MSYEQSRSEVQRGHTLSMENRDKLSLTGVEDVSGFDESLVVLTTSMGELTVRGEGLHIERIDLDSGQLEVRGKVQELSYDESAQGALDVLFCAAGGALFFLLAMRSESGRMGTWSLAASAVGFCMYMHTLSAHLLPVFAAVDAAAVRAAQGCKEVIKKFCKYAKSIFQKSRECFIIKHKQKAD